MPIHLQNKLLVYNRDGCQKHSGQGTTIVTAGRSVVAKLVMGGKEYTGAQRELCGVMGCSHLSCGYYMTVQNGQSSPI